MCGAAYIPTEMAKKPKINGFAAAGEAYTTEGRGGQKRGTRGVTTL